MPATYEPIATNTLGTATTSITFSSISGSYTDLIIQGQAGNSTFGGTDFTDLRIRFNSDTGSNYSDTIMKGNNSTATSTRSNSSAFILAGWYPISNNSNYFGATIIQISNYSNATTYKTALTRTNLALTGGAVLASVGTWRNTAAITSVTITSDGSWPFMTGTTFTLYGIKAA